MWKERGHHKIVAQRVPTLEPNLKDGPTPPQAWLTETDLNFLVAKFECFGFRGGA
jgi:hypothetical protein